MSKNPFRRRQPETALSVDVDQDTSKSLEPYSTDNGRQVSKPKRVRIATPPPLSPDSVKSASYDDSPPLQRVSDEVHPGSPPPSSLPPAESVSDSSDSTIEPSAEDPFDRPSDEEREELTGEATFEYDKSRDPATMFSVSQSRPPKGNPFQKTLATMEEDPKYTDASSEYISESTEQKVQRPTMDVDAFKRLLMTGSTDPTASDVSPAAKYTSGNSSSYFVTDSSSTDTSSLSRQSIFEANHDPHSETPRTSTEEMRSEDEANEARSALKQIQKPKPPPPRRRHGRSAGPSSDAHPGVQSSYNATGLSKEASQVDNSVSPVGRKSIVSSKPLPSPSIVNESRFGFESSILENAERSATHSAMHTPLLLDRESNPPHPEQRSLPTDSITDSPESPSDQDHTSTLESIPSKRSKAPPPPPARRLGNRVAPGDRPSLHATPSSPTVTSELPASANIPLQTLSRTTSTSSRNHGVPPLPPPTRRRGSSKSSLEGSHQGVAISPRTSQESSRVEGAKSSSPPENIGTSVAPAGEPQNVLADLSVLQREVDALRAKYGKPNF